MWLQPGPNKSAPLIPLMSSILALMSTEQDWLRQAGAGALYPFVVAEVPGLPQG